ncbi:carbohydrate sulfotransferase 8-like [Pelobates fuscus]|uniref:carbohydrate sulfotransferase 8-like n=1 Tax=Pelobates fuscus TaxID=191477 RepID=UPI002FE48A7B
MKWRMYRNLFCFLILCRLYGLFFNTQWIKDFFKVHNQNSVTQTHRKNIMKLVCQQNNRTFNSSYRIPSFVSRQLYVEHSYKFIYCEVPKVGCTNWKRIILLLNKTFAVSHEDLEHFEVHTNSLLVRLSSYNYSQQMEMLQNYTKVMFVRDPLHRLVSAYRDKFLHEENIYYSKTFADRIKAKIRKNKNSSQKVTFEEFARFIIQENERYRDIHWKPMHALCDPCNIQYDIVGKFETMKEDSDFVLKTIKAPNHFQYPNIKHYPNESRTNEEISMKYFNSLPPKVFEDLIDVYREDFSLFQYLPVNRTKTQKIPEK